MLFFALMVTVVSGLVLAVVANVLRPYQERNIKLEQMSYILRAAGYAGDDIEAAFEQYVTPLVVDHQGKVVLEGNTPENREKILKLNILSELKKKPEQRTLPVYQYHAEGKTLFIFPVAGKGLWGPIWGYVALDADLNTIVGVVFDHKSETPGLGAEITKPWFQGQFVGKKLFDANGRLVGVAVVKGQAPEDDPHAVDGITGATLTGKGVSEMFVEMFKWYQPYIRNLRQQAANSVGSVLLNAA